MSTVDIAARLARGDRTSELRSPRPTPGEAMKTVQAALTFEMLEHVAAGLVVHLGLELEVVLQRDRLGRRRPGRDLVDQPLDVGIFRDRILAHHEGDHAGPAPHVHVDDGVGVADHVAALGEMVVEDAEMPLRLELVAVMGVVDLFRRKMLEVDGLAGIRADAGGDEHQPGQQFGAVGRRVGGQKLAGLFGEIEQDGVAVEHLDAVVVDRGHLGVRIDRRDIPA